jgi:hypothetical protein
MDFGLDSNVKKTPVPKKDENILKNKPVTERS